MENKYDVNYEDERFQKVETDKKASLSQLEQTYAAMQEEAQGLYQSQIDATKAFAEEQSQLQQEQHDLAIQELEQQKEDAQQDYLKEQSGAYADWQKQSGDFSVNAEAQASQGMTGTGYSESSQVAMYNTYQNRVAQARESYTQAVRSFDTAMAQARLQNSSALAQIALETFQQQLALTLQGFEYRSDLALALADRRAQLDDRYYGRYLDVQDQINRENDLALEREKFAFEQEKYAAKRRSGGKGSSGKEFLLMMNSANTMDVTGKLNSMIASGATKAEVSGQISSALDAGYISREQADALKSTYLPKGYTY